MGPGLSDELRWRVMFRDGFRCVYCGRTGECRPLTVDHAIPVSLGGENTIFNLVTACATCNVEKADAPLPADELERIILMGRDWEPGRPPSHIVYDDKALDRVEKMRAWGAGYKRIARAVGCSRDTAKWLVDRAERRARRADVSFEKAA